MPKDLNHTQVKFTQTINPQANQFIKSKPKWSEHT